MMKVYRWGGGGLLRVRGRVRVSVICQVKHGFLYDVFCLTLSMEGFRLLSKFHSSKDKEIP